MCLFQSTPEGGRKFRLKFCTFLLLPTYQGIRQLSKPDLKVSVYGAFDQFLEFSR